jgi:hypothetical protein
MLPQRRKSAEEIAKLRESLGIPGEAPEQAEPELAPPSPATFAPPPASATPVPAVGTVSAAPIKAKPPIPEPAPGIPEESEPVEAAEVVLSTAAPKIVRSLRKSEQVPLETRPVDDSVNVVRVDAAPIPLHRHSDRELMEMRRVQATPPDTAISHIRHLAVPWPLVALGYLLPLSGALFAWLAHWTPDVVPMDFPAQWMADLSRQPWLGQAGFILLCSLCGLGLLFAGGFALKKPRSRHHAGFITIIAILILAFGIIHHFSPTYGP